MVKPRHLVFRAALVLAACALVFSCSRRKSADSLSKVKSRGIISVATSPDFPPFEQLDEKGSITGLEIELFRRIAEDIGVKAEFSNVDFDSIIPGVVSGKYDMGVSGFSITEERKSNVLFSDPFTLAGIAVVVRQEDKDIRVKSADDLRGKSVSVQSGTTSSTFCSENGLSASEYASNMEAELALVTRKTDVWVIDNEVGAQMVGVYNSEHSDKLVMLDDLLSFEQYAFLAAKGSDSLVEAVNASLRKFVADGTVERLFRQFGADYKRPAL